jgi:hypothetical protein
MKIIVPIDDLVIELFPDFSKYSNNIEANLEEVKNLISVVTFGLPDTKTTLRKTKKVICLHLTHNK